MRHIAGDSKLQSCRFEKLKLLIFSCFTVQLIWLHNKAFSHLCS